MRPPNAPRHLLHQPPCSSLPFYTSPLGPHLMARGLHTQARLHSSPSLPVTDITHLCPHQPLHSLLPSSASLLRASTHQHMACTPRTARLPPPQPVSAILRDLLLLVFVLSFCCIFCFSIFLLLLAGSNLLGSGCFILWRRP